MVKVNISKDISGRIVVSFPYDPSTLTKIKAIDGRRWHPIEKHWSFPNTDGTLQKILKVFEGEELHIDPALTPPSPLNLRGDGGVSLRRPAKRACLKEIQLHPALLQKCGVLQQEFH